LAKRFEAKSEGAAAQGTREGGKRFAAVETEGLTAAEVQAKLLPFPEWLRRWVTRKITRAFIRDSNEFFFEPKARERMIQSVLERIRPGGGPSSSSATAKVRWWRMRASTTQSRRMRDAAIRDDRLAVGIQEVQDQINGLWTWGALPSPDV